MSDFYERLENGIDAVIAVTAKFWKCIYVNSCSCACVISATASVSVVIVGVATDSA